MTSPLAPRRTPAAPVTVEGTGLFTDSPARCTIEPAEAGAGIVFVHNSVEIPASIERLAPSPITAFAALPARHTCLALDTARVITCEHVLSALVGLGVTDARVTLGDSGELPIGDGSANLFADATAMGLGEFLSSRSEQDVYRAARRKEEREIVRNPDRGWSEVIDILIARGMKWEDAHRIADVIVRNPAFMADFMMQYQVGMADPEESSPAARATMTFVSFIAFGSAPLLPYFLLGPDPATFRISAFATFAALVALGLLRWKVTSETLRRCVGETVLVGGICALVAYAVGLAFTVN